MEFVNKMRKEHKLIMGIGHRVKSVSSKMITLLLYIRNLSMPSGHKTIKNCLTIRQHKIGFVLTFTQNDLTLVEIHTVVLHFGLDTCQIKLGFVLKVLDTMCYYNIAENIGKFSYLEEKS